MYDRSHRISRCAYTRNTHHRDCSQRAPAVICYCLVDFTQAKCFQSSSSTSSRSYTTTQHSLLHHHHSVKSYKNVGRNTSVSTQQYLPRPHRAPAKQRPLRAPQSPSTPSRNQQCTTFNRRVRRRSARRSRRFHDILPTTHLQDEVQRQALSTFNRTSRTPRPRDLGHRDSRISQIKRLSSHIRDLVRAYEYTRERCKNRHGKLGRVRSRHKSEPLRA